VFAIFIAAALLASMAGIVPAGAAPQDRGGPPKLPSRVTSGSIDVAGAKLDGRLAELVSEAGREGTAAEAVVEVAVLAAKDAKKPAEMIRPVKMTLRGDPANDLWVGTAKVGKLLKLASAKDVVFVFENGRREPPKIPDSGGGGADLSDFEKKAAVAKVRARVDAALDAGAAELFREQLDDEGSLTEAADDPIDYDGGAATGWFDVSPVGHDSEGAWDQGYRGAGVKVAVADDSCDFAHPDLMGTHAVIDDPTSPYDGWPQAFDPFSLLLYTYDAFYGQSYVAGGDTWFSDTSDTVTGLVTTYGSEEITTTGTSKSGDYHIGYLWDENYYYYGFGEFPLVLVADENTAGVYDTVYVDLDADRDFTYDKACTKDDPVSYADLWDYDYTPGPDGFADISGGMIYWIADGTNQPPGAEFVFSGMDWSSVPAPDSGEMVCFMGALNVDEDHGTLCSSNVVGQGMTDAPSVWGDYPSFKTPDPSSGNGIVQGAAPEAGLVAIADIYWDHFASTLAAYDYAAFGLDDEPHTGDDVQIVSNSYGESDEDADGWDYRSRYVTYLNLYWNNEVSYLFSTGNGAPGYGTTAPPGPATGIAVGASTQMGACGGWDSIYDADQVTAGDVIPWSNRGPNASGGLSPDIVADGAYSSGAVPTNMYWYEGSSSWDIWGGTSRSAPVAAGNLALIFQAYKDRTGFWPNNDMAKDLIMNGARDLNYDTLVQGAGSVNANRSVSIAAGNGGVLVSPSSWNPGDYLGESYPSFARVVHPDESYEGSIRLENTGADSVSMTISDAWYVNTGSESYGITLDAADLDPYDFNRPDYLLDITDIIPDGTDLVVIRTTQDIEDFAPTGDFDTDGATHNATRPVVYDWKDQDTSGTLWTDGDSDGFVDEGEIDEGEYMRFTYHNNFANTHEVRVQTPKERMHDGVYLGVQWATRADGATTTDLDVEITFWNRTDCSWLEFDGGATVDPGEATARSVTLNVPADAPVGIYEAQLRLDDGTDVTVIPVVINVAADTYAFDFGDATMVPNALMSNREVYGTQDWRWRAESGDWRFFWTDGSAADALPPGAAWLVRTIWEDRGAPAGLDTDIDTLLYGPEMDIFSDYFPNEFGPYGMGLKGGSANTNIGAGIWTFQTNSGTTEEWVAGSLEAGLNQVMVHNVLYDGKAVGQRFSGETGVISVDPGRLDIVSAADSATELLDFTTYDLDLTGAAVQAYGLSKRIFETDTISTDEDWYYFMDLTDAAYLDVQTACPGQDIDLYLYWWNGSDYEMVGASETSGDEEVIRLTMPADGQYVIDVYGYSVSGTQPFDVAISAPMGDDLLISGVPAGGISAGTGFTLDVDWTKVRGTLEEREGEYEGIIFIGPTEAPGAVQVPVTLRYPFEIESSTPAHNALGVALDTDVSVTFSKRVDPTTLDDTTFFLMKGMDIIPGDIDYDDPSATAVFTPDEALLPGVNYEMVIDGVWSADGDTLNADIPFRTEAVLDASRIAGEDRILTALEVSQAGFADDSVETVVIATAYNWPDALGGAALAGAVKGPILLTSPTALPAVVLTEIDRVGATSAIILGGTSAVGAPVEAALNAKLGDTNVDRIGGADRYQTARNIAARVVDELGPGYDGTAFLATGANFPDALGASPLAAAKGWPIYLVNPVTGADAALISAMQSDDVDGLLILGGTAAIPDAIAVKLAADVPCKTLRLSGNDRYATAVDVATYGVDVAGLSWDKLAIATGTNFPDALAGGVLQGKNGSVMLLTTPTALHDSVRTVLEANKLTIETVYFLGGSNAVSDIVFDAVVDILE
jgi:putative cell wall-binding protein